MGADRQNTTARKHTGTGGSAARGAFPTLGDLTAMVAIFFIASLIGGFCMYGIGRIVPQLRRELLTAIVYCVQFISAIGGILIYRRSRGARHGVFHFSVKWYNASLVLLGILLILTTGIVIEPLLNLFPDHYFEQLQHAIGHGGWAILLTVLLAPVFEELLFRGLVLESARQKWGPTTAILLSAAFFGLVHLPILPQMLNAFVMGVIMGYIYVLTDSLLSVIVIHAVNNGLAYMAMELTGSQETDMRSMLANDTVYWILFGLSLAIFLISLGVMAVAATNKRRKRAEIAAVFTDTPPQHTPGGDSPAEQ